MKPLDLDHFRSIVEHSPAMSWSAGLDARCDHVNAAWLAFTGRALADELGDGWQASIHPDDRASHLALYLDRFMRREAFETECRLLRHDGVYRYVVVRGAPRNGEAGQFAGFVASCFDIHDRPGSDASGAADFFEMLLDHLCVAGFDGYWKRLNPSWTRTLGWTTRELMSKPLIEFVHPEDRAATLAARGQLQRGEPILSLTNRYRCKDGTYRWFDWRSVSDIDRQLVYAVARDVTEEHAVRRALREQTESLTATLNSIADGVVATDATAAIARMNSVAEALTGWPASEALGKPLGDVFDVVRADTHAAATLPIERTLEEGLASEGTEHTLLIARNGTELPIAFSRAPMKNGKGEVSGAVIVFRDMTAERLARQDKERLQQQLMLADRMASLGTLVAGVAHEINNPLSYVMANLELICDELRGLDAGSLSGRATAWIEMAEAAREGAGRIGRVVRGLKSFSRSEEEERLVLLDVHSVLELASDMTWSEIKQRARLVKDYGVMPLVHADESRLGQVFVNLLVNAAQAIGASNTDTDEIRIVTSTDAAGQAVIEIVDTGPGVPLEVVDRIFDPFFTTKPIGIGTGLGLAIAHGIVTKMAGQITVRNRSEGGAAFRVTLPGAAAALIAEPTVPAAVRRGTERRASVLVVDDERAIGVMLSRVLRDHDVTAVTSAKDALELIDSGASFDVILSDLMMPVMSGMELHDILVRRHARLAERVIFITGGAFTPAAETFLDYVPNERLGKPFDATAVRSLVDRFVR
jgi:PAS domain S-box-containing protein